MYQFSRHHMTLACLIGWPLHSIPPNTIQYNTKLSTILFQYNANPSGCDYYSGKEAKYPYSFFSISQLPSLVLGRIWTHNFLIFVNL